MRTRSTSDRRSEEERRTNGPFNINKRFHEDEIDKRQEKQRPARTSEPWEVHLELRTEEGTKIEWASLLNHQIRENFFFQNFKRKRALVRDIREGRLWDQPGSKKELL